MADLDTLRPEVHAAMEAMDADVQTLEWLCIRAELLRLAADRRRADVIRDSYMTQLTQTQLERGDAIQRAEKAEADVERLREELFQVRRAHTEMLGHFNALANRYDRDCKRAPRGG
ncbi:MAG: hypothetical protein KGL39_60510 [Patescibacteria group bacterium]|nr:hypothetical protein [Patescibacteria group bacterium]